VNASKGTLCGIGLAESRGFYGMGSGLFAAIRILVFPRLFSPSNFSPHASVRCIIMGKH